MPAVKIYLEQAEYDALARYAEALGVSCQDIAYAGLNRLMLSCEDTEVNRDIVETRDWRRNNLPLWSDSACAVHAYEASSDDQPVRSRFI